MSSDRDFLKALSDEGHRKLAGAAFSRKLKTAGIAGDLSRAISPHKHEIGGAVIGAALTTALNYAANRPGKDGGLSALQETSQKAYEKAQAMAASDRKNKRPLSFSTRVALIASKGSRDLADVFVQHPGKGALLGAPMGAGAGLSVARLMK